MTSPHLILKQCHNHRMGQVKCRGKAVGLRSHSRDPALNPRRWAGWQSLEPMLFMEAWKLPIINRYLLLCTLAWWILWSQDLKSYSPLRSPVLAYIRKDCPPPDSPWSSPSSGLLCQGEGLSSEWAQVWRDEDRAPHGRYELLQSLGLP